MLPDVLFFFFLLFIPRFSAKKILYCLTEETKSPTVHLGCPGGKKINIFGWTIYLCEKKMVWFVFSFLHDVGLKIRSMLTERYNLKLFKTSPIYTGLHSKHRPSQCETITQLSQGTAMNDASSLTYEVEHSEVWVLLMYKRYSGMELNSHAFMLIRPNDRAFSVIIICKSFRV